MSHQSPMIAMPKKTTDEVDWTTPIRTLIAQSYGESPDNYAAECVALQRCRQDAVRGAGSDMTARDLLYKYFGQLELLELRFSEIKVTFPWHDAFTTKLTTQTSIAYEKASILFQIAVTHSSIAASQSRSDPECLKRSFYYFKTCAGMLTYINENFLHAPSTDLSRDVVKFLVGLILAQASEVFFEKCTDEKKGNALVSKVASQAATMYAGLCEDVKEFMGKGIFDRNWVLLIQIKTKHFQALAQYYRALADTASSKHGDALVRLTFAETLAKEATRLAATFSAIFVGTVSPTLPADAGTSIHELTKANLAICTERKNEAQRENDLIYNAVLPAVDALPPIAPAVVATPIPIQEVYSTPEVQKVIGTDIFIRLVPLSVHESASVYSEEKAKLVRGEVEKSESAEVEMRSAIDAVGVKEGLSRFKAMVSSVNDDEVESVIPLDVRRWMDDISLMESREPVETLLAKLGSMKSQVHQALDTVSRDLEMESKDCEMMRVKYDHLWTQAPSASLTRPLRQDLKSHFGALEAAAGSDGQVVQIWEAVRGDVRVLTSNEDVVESVFRAASEVSGGSLLDLDGEAGADNDDDEKMKIAHYVEEIDERLTRLTKISKERADILKDLKEKIQTDDVSHLLLLNRRNTGVEPTLFAAELEKFRPYQQRLASSVHHQQAAIHEITSMWKSLKLLAGGKKGGGKVSKKWEERERKKADANKRFERARDGYMEVRDGLAKGLQFYTELTELSSSLQVNAKTFVSSRVSERASLVGKAEAERRLSSTSSAPPPLAQKPQRPPPPPSAPSGLEQSFASMDLRSPPSAPPPAPQWNAPQQSPPPPQSYTQYASSPPPPPPQSRPSYLPPPPPQPAQSSYAPSPPSVDPYASLGMFTTSQPQHQHPATAFPPPPPPLGTSYMPYAPQQPQQAYPPPPPQQPTYQQHYQPQQPQYPSQSAFPPPPPPVQNNYQSYGASSPPPAPSQQTSYQPYTSQQQPQQQPQQPQQPQGGYYYQGR